MSNSLRTIAAISLLAILCLAPSARAQLRSSSDAPLAPNLPLNDLKAALPYVHWDGAARGPLIAITPEKVHWESYRPIGNPKEGVEPDPLATQPLLSPAAGYGLSADVVARHFSRKLVRLSTITVFAPPTMYLLNTDLKPINPYLGAQASDRMRRLEASLTPSQWQLLGSPNGIGMGDLSRDQQDIFDAALPPTMTVMQGTVRDFGSGNIGTTIDNAGSQTLTTEQRQGVRLRLDRRVNFNLLGEKEGYSYGFSSTGSDAIGTKKLMLTSEGQAARDMSRVFGQDVRFEAPNRLKRSDLDLKQANLRETYVPLTGVQTVSDLLKVVKTATGVELYADGRLGRLSVYISSDRQSVRAADVLESLCWALTATYRKVGPAPGADPKDFAYVLTYDQAGLAPLRGLISHWARRGGTDLQTKTSALNETISKQKPLQYLKFTADDPLRPTPQAEQALRDQRRDQAETGHYSQQSVPVAALSSTQRQQVSDAIQKMEAQHQGRPNDVAVRSDRVGMWEGVGITYVIPGVGEIADGSTWSDSSTTDDDEAERAVIADAQKKRQQKETQEREKQIAARQAIVVSRVVLGISPASAEEAQPILTAARRLGVGEVWVTTPNTPAGRATLAQCVALGNAAGVKVGAKVRLISTPADTALDPGEIDQNLFGETGSAWGAHIKQIIDGQDTRYLYSAPKPDDQRDTFASESPTARKRLEQAVEEVVATPGLSGVAIADAASPGRDWGSPAPDYYFSWPGATFGYTVANRLAFLRQKGYDPIDLASRGYDYAYGAQNLQQATQLPRFDVDNDQVANYYYGQPPDTASATKAWSSFLADGEREMLRSLRADLEKAQPRLPVYLTSVTTDQTNWTNDGCALWQSGAPVPFSSPTPAQAAHTPIVATSAHSVAPSTEAVPETLRYFPLGKTFASVFAPDAKKEASYGLSGHPSVFENAAYYIYFSMKPTPGQPAAAPPGILLDLTGLKPADALTLLTGILEKLNLTLRPAAPKTP